MKIKKPIFWDQKKPNIFAYILIPFSITYQIITFIRRKLSKKQKFQIRTICVGNFYIGGTGKTSLCLKLKEILDANFKVSFIKKYNKKHLDEIKLLEKYGKVYSSKSRKNSLMQAESDGYDIAIFDDGLQDFSIDYDHTFVCFNKNNFIGNGHIIPSGPLREKISNIKYHQNIILTGNNNNSFDFENYFRKFNGKINFYEARYKIVNLEEIDIDKNFLIFSGIGNHSTFIETLKSNKIQISKEIEFPDHYFYKDYEIEKIMSDAEKLELDVLTTQKDYMRINEKFKEKIKFIKIEMEIRDKNKLENYLNK